MNKNDNSTTSATNGNPTTITGNYTTVSGEYQPQDLPKKLITHVFRVLGCMKKL